MSYAASMLRPLHSALVVALLVASGGCTRERTDTPEARPATPTATATAVAPSRTDVARMSDADRLARMLGRDNIGRRLDIFERISGEPEDATATTATYRVAGCMVDVETADHAIVWIDLRLGTPGCRVDLAPILRRHRVADARNPLTYAELERLMDDHAEYRVLCLGASCGPDGQPDFEAVFPGTRDNGFVAIAGASDPLSPGAQRQVGDWVRALTAAGGGYGVLSELQCTRAYDPLARRTLANAVVQKLGFGENEDTDCGDEGDEGDDAEPWIEQAGALRT